MSARPGSAGATRTCPHCKATILESASVCPACRGHLRYDDAAIARAKTATYPLQIEGTISPPESDTIYEYSKTVSPSGGVIVPSICSGWIAVFARAIAASS